MNESQKLKRHETQLRKLDEEIRGIHRQKGSLDNRLKEYTEKRNKIISAIQEMKRAHKLIVSEHAILRYLERINGINIEEISEKIASEEIKKAYGVAGNGTYNFDGFNVVIRDNIVVTIED